ncbi:Ferrochelatase [Granulibacter bethesdensis]|uniref:ferrochelatase n=1 Tax=Granulibacter bethesdensis TaxID=364410 RepID=UPI0003F20CDD|nr:ferrochelatase [Granulibacter bethesdensis]AHJ69644.1 Ferrochelatase [Granulibacter bethesdensis]
MPMISNVSCTPPSPHDDSLPPVGSGKRRKLAVVLFNLGGPDSPAAIRPFLLNLFKDPAILRVPFFVRPILARIIAKARVKPASENYALLGGKSPLLELTQEQARTLEQALPEFEARCFIAMRYWHPFAHETVREVKDWDPDEIILLPLYPQYSTTTTGSSLTDWREAAAAAGLAKQTFSLCCYHSDRDFASATAALVRKAYDEARNTLPDDVPLRLLFSAHGLPEVIVKKGDPYQFQVERSTAAVLRAMNIPGLDHQICYQSRATPQVWLGPSTEEAIDRAVEDGVAVLVVPIAFVSEHSETLVELDVEYAELAHGKNIKGYFRVPTQNSDPGFIDSLAGLVRRVREHGPGLCSFAGGRVCPRIHRDCPHGEQEDAA